MQPHAVGPQRPTSENILLTPARQAVVLAKAQQRDVISISGDQPALQPMLGTKLFRCCSDAWPGVDLRKQRQKQTVRRRRLGAEQRKLRHSSSSQLNAKFASVQTT